LQAAQGQISFTFDIWSDSQLCPFLAVTAHWIAKESEKEALVLKAALITFHHIPGSHTGMALALKILELIDHAEVKHNVGVLLYFITFSDFVQIGHFTLDNTSNNRTAMDELSQLLQKDGIEFDAVDHCIPCFPHIVNICVQHILSEHSTADFSDLADTFVARPYIFNKVEYVKALQNNVINQARDIVHVICVSGQCCDSFELPLLLVMQRDGL
jgi:hypothetical protein